MGKKLILTGGSRLLLSRDAKGRLRYPEEGSVSLPDVVETFSFGDYIAASKNGVESSESLIDMGLREAYAMLPEGEYAAATKAAELINWNEEERFCGRCGARLRRATEISKKCPGCGTEYFPRLNPAIVVLVEKGDEALLVHARNFKRPEMMALVAGFVETGESLEECVAREIKEETDLDVTNITYVGSQSWPFPHQLMLGFRARYAGGTLKYADGELSAGGFFTRENVPELPTPPSLSRHIIDSWLSEHPYGEIASPQ